MPPGTCTTTLTWKKVPTEGTQIEVYGVTGCLSQTKRAGDGSCLVVGTVVPTSTRKLIAQAPASKGTVSWTGPAWLDNIDVATTGPRSEAIGVDRHGDDIYFAIIVRASNEVGDSKFVIADVGTWCYDTGCAGPYKGAANQARGGRFHSRSRICGQPVRADRGARVPE